MNKKHQFGISNIGHRGFAAAYPENTLLSFSKAIETGADYVELDVHSSSDGILVVCHDGSTKRTGSAEYIISQTSFDQLRTLDMGKGEKMPTLQEVFDLCKGKIGIQIEIKGSGVADKVVELIHKNQMRDEIAISSFTHSELQRVKELDDKIICAALLPTPKGAVKNIFSRKSLIDSTLAIKADGFHPFYKLINSKLIKLAKEKNLFVNAWTVDSPVTWGKLIQLGVDGIITNDPASLKVYLEARFK
jgi:glycerophosphoryl diester phosphodiesterase